MRSVQRAELLAEAGELIERIGGACSDLEKAGPSAINELYRLVHTFKGLAGLLDAAEVRSVAHALEDVLDELRLGRIERSDRLEGAVLAAVEACALGLGGGRTDFEAAIEAMRGAAVPISGAGDEAPLASLGLEPRILDSLTEYERARLLDAARSGRSILRVEVAVAAARFDVELEAIQGRIADGGEAVALLPLAAGEGEVGFEILASTSRPRELADELSGLGATTAVLGPEDAPEQPASIRVELRQLVEIERLADALAERSADAGALRAAIRSLRVGLAGELFERMELLVARIAGAWGREVELVCSGAWVPLERRVIQGLSEPLLHLVRNALAHGIEAPPVRLAAGKRARGLLSLEVRRLVGSVELTVADDGAGVDEVALLGAAATRGLRLVRPLDAIFLPGFTTAVSADERSGRGMGLSSVRSAVERIGGSVSVESTRGAGTRFRIVVPSAT